VIGIIFFNFLAGLLAEIAIATCSSPKEKEVEEDPK
jgi:hypothetical protein